MPNHTYLYNTPKRIILDRKIMSKHLIMGDFCH